ncbi:hypothetical protein CRM22_006010 [Opisthorchis felineus]|uniref:RING-type domain-containing protein n=1 Tax=Opisthorchis felineus TaxID=147828 RepID=A0A4S2LNA0_OPIFE|nr:hypothetical protein CRM22_006010 [Opisthorchis felineus]
MDVLMSRRAIRYMNTVFRDATSEDLAASSDTVCIICREDMQLPGAGSQLNQNTALKRLPCSHIFHVGCLRSWFQRQQTCPTCRMDVIRQARQQELQGSQAHQQPRGQTGRNPGPSVPTSSSSSVAPDAAARPPWLQTPPGQFPFFPPYFGTTVPVAAQPTASVAGMPVYPPVSGPLFAPPFFGMPIIYPGKIY